MNNPFDKQSLSALEHLLQGESTRIFQQQATQLVAKYGAVETELKNLRDKSKQSISALDNIFSDAARWVDPHWGLIDPYRLDSDISLIRFLDTVGGVLLTKISNSCNNLSTINRYCATILKMLGGDVKLDTMTWAEEAVSNLTREVAKEFTASVLSWDKMLAGIYLSTRKEYKKLRKKYLGEAAKQEDHDPMEDQLMSQLFGFAPKPPEVPLGPATALIDDNCVLTQMLTDLVDLAPKYYERTHPIMRRGKVTDKVKKTKTIDEGEVEDYSHTLLRTSHHTYIQYATDPSYMLGKLASIMSNYYAGYSGVDKALLDLLVATGDDIALLGNQQNTNRQMTDPRVILTRYSRINFLTIRPAYEDIAPKSRMEKEYAAARTKLLTKLKDTLTAASSMDSNAPDTEAYVNKAARDIMDLKAEMDEVIKTEHQKLLARNIEDDNEFYIGKSGNIGGALEVAREPAPKITYEDVVGVSFVKAKEHVEEVIKVASHPHVMRLSAPRGDIRSNLLLIGPFGCGKSEMARAVAADKRIIGFNVATADLLTAYMHESVKNIKRMYDHAKDMRRRSRNTKPVCILLDEFDRLFRFGEGVHAAYDGDRMEGTIQEMMDGIVGYEGVFIVALTNVPKHVPEAILRRFKFVDVVGQLTDQERADLFKKFLTKGLPISPVINESDYLKWAEMLVDAPGDVIGKVADEVHFKFMHDFAVSGKIEGVERTLAKRLRDREVNDKDREYIKRALSSHGWVGMEEITKALDEVLKQPQVQMQIKKAKAVYKDADEIMQGLSTIDDTGLGFLSGGKKRSNMWS